MDVRHQNDAPDPTPALEMRLGALARRHYGYATTQELKAIGLGRGAIARRTRSARLHRRHLGVYAIGYARLEPIALAAAAVLAGGPGAVLSHGSAAALWDLSRTWPAPPEVTAASDRRAAGVRWHQSSSFGSRDVRVHRGIPVTSAARTLLDIAARLDDAALRRAISDARIARYASDTELLDLIGRRGTTPGAARLREMLTHGPTRSQLEDAFLVFARRHSLPVPLINTRVAGYEVDALFAAERVIVELDGWEYHRDRHSFETDRSRDAATLAAGYVTVRLTAAMLSLEAQPATAARLRSILENRRPRARAQATPA